MIVYLRLHNLLNKNSNRHDTVMSLYWHYGMVRMSRLYEEASLDARKEPMPEQVEIRITCVHCGGDPLKCRHVALLTPWYRSGTEICKACGVNKVGTDPWGKTYCYACGSPTDRTEGANPGRSETLAGSRNEPEDLVSSSKGEEKC